MAFSKAIEVFLNEDGSLSEKFKQKAASLFDAALKTRVVNELANVVRQFPLREQTLALNILRDAGYPELADLQARNGYDFDIKAGNWISTDDPRTHPERVYADSAEMVGKIANIEQQLTKDGLSPNEIRRYVDALRNAMTSSGRQTVEKAIAQERYNVAARSAATDILAETKLNRRKRQEQEDKAFTKIAANYIKKTSR